MRVGLDGIPLATPRTGVGHYTFELARHLALVEPESQFELLTPFPFKPPIPAHELPAGLRAVQVKVNTLKRRWFAVGLPLHLRQAKFDLFHGTNYEVPLWSKGPTVLTIHDLSLLLHPETHVDRLVRRGRRRLPIMARSATTIITPSTAIKGEVVQHLGINPSRVIVVPEAPRSSFHPIPFAETAETRQRLGVEDNFILFTGTLEPRKNLATLLKAFEQVLTSTSLRPQLVIAGKKGWLMDDPDTELKTSGFEEHVRFTGYLEDDDLRALYSSCRVFVYPSLYEGFGLPPIEAMACGAPVIISRIPTLLETAGIETTRQVEPLDASGMAHTIVRLLENDGERQYLSAGGIKHARNFTWERVARETLEVYRGALAGRRKAAPARVSL